MDSILISFDVFGLMILDPCHRGQLHPCTLIGSSIKPATNSIKPCCRSGQRSLPCSSWKSHYPSLLLASPSSFKLDIRRAVSTKCEQPPPCAVGVGVLVAGERPPDSPKGVPRFPCSKWLRASPAGPGRHVRGA